jgi:hypothetical protein
MKYWIDLFTWNTWQEFLGAGGTVSGFREKRWRTVQRIKPGDVFLCYLTGLSRFIGILEVTGEPYFDHAPIWGEAIFPSRLPVRVVLSLQPDHGIPVTSLASQLSYFQDMKSPHSWSGHFRGSPTEERPEDAQVIIAAMQEAEISPISREFDPRKLERKVPLYETDSGSVTVPEDIETFPMDFLQAESELEVTHEEIQWLLLRVGSEMGLDVWVALNDKGRSFDGNQFQHLPRLRSSVPRQFDEATNKTIELIDVLWLRENAIVAAFEIEHTTSIYSGLLRLSDLVSMQPNINIRLYIVAPDERRDKVFTEVNRPTFSRMKPPLRELCKFIPYSSLKEKLEQVGDFLPYLRPESLMKLQKHLKPILRKETRI